ncbi:CBS domain-containing protein [Motiliproteus sediminis]|uniref:CBS domain-containing protein n=1 Tax=Motiliproteus sediminis TaxID=1468178 RepID=UPI001AEF52EF|nr:CBS domain-containing protein [Motiliproteus sediminis]
MALVIVDHGYRIQTPVKFSRRGVEGMTQLQRARTLPPNDRRVNAPDYDNRPSGHETPVARQARQAYNQTAKLTEPGQTRRRITVAKVMTAPVYTIKQGVSLDEAWAQMQEHRVHQLAVVNDDGMLFGLLSDRDLLTRTSPLAQTGPVSNAADIEGCYQTQLIVATPDTEARLVALVLLEKHTNAVPVLSDAGELVGIVTRSDLLHLIGNDPDFENWA